jgi:hypothetical protein
MVYFFYPTTYVGSPPSCNVLFAVDTRERTTDHENEPMPVSAQRPCGHLIRRRCNRPIFCPAQSSTDESRAAVQSMPRAIGSGLHQLQVRPFPMTERQASRIFDSAAFNLSRHAIHLLAPLSTRRPTLGPLVAALRKNGGRRNKIRKNNNLRYFGCFGVCLNCYIFQKSRQKPFGGVIKNCAFVGGS